MEKKRFLSLRKGEVRKLMLMHILTFFLLLILLPGMAVTHAQNKINVEVRRGTLQDVFTVIQEQSNFRFLYSTEDVVSVKVANISVKDLELENVLETVLKGSGLTYQISDHIIFIKKMKDIPQQVNAIKISGKVINLQGEVLPGVSIFIKGTTLGCATDQDGMYTLTVPETEGLVLVFSFIGMKSQEVAYKGNKTMNVKLEDEVKSIDEVVVTGYFNKNKSGFTGNASTYSAEELKRVNPGNLLSALSILDPSFKMVENNLDGSNPNVIPDFQIRGAASIPGGAEVKSTFSGNPNMPTFILDGFEVTAEKVFDLDPMRIESMTILKDAAATAIYGSRATNGVVVINTKQPETGKIRVSYNVDLSFNIPDLTDYDLLNGKEKLELEKAAGYFEPFGTVEQSEARERDYNYRLGLVQKGYNTYWLDKPLHTTVGHKHSLSVEGGESAMRYSLDLTYENMPGVMKESGRERMGMGVMLLYRFNNVTFRNTITYDNVKSEDSPYGSFRDYARLNSYYPYRDKDGNYLKMLEEYSLALGRNDVINPLYNTTLNTIDETSYSQFVNNFGIDWFINADLRLKGNFAIRHKKNEGTVFKPADHTDFIAYSEEDYYRKGYYQATQGKEFFYDGNVVFSYFKQLHRHTLNANVAWNIQAGAGDEYSVRAEGFQEERLDYITFAAQNAEYYLPTGEDYISRLMGFVGNVGYSYRDCYLLDASFRYDGSSKFGADSRWAPFWSLGLGWNIHKEKFAENWDWANVLKIRASYGVTGSQSFDPYQAMIMYKYYTQERYRNNIGAVMMGLGNPNLKWQQTDQLNIGMDITVLNEYLSVSANYYRNISKDLLTDVTLPPSLGYPTFRENLGKIENEGYELNLKVALLRKGENYLNITASAIHNTNILKKISNSLQAWNKEQDASEENLNVPKVRYVEGESINSIWGVPSLGINPANGKEMFFAADGSRTDLWKAANQRVIGCSDPKLEGNMGLNAGYKGIQLNLYFQYRLGGQAYNYTLVDRVENADKRYNTDRRVLEQRWQEAGDITFFKDMKNESATRPTSRFVQDYNYLQLSSLNLSYDFPRQLIQRWSMESLRLSFSMNDVFRASSVKTERGLDYPFARAFRTSLRVTF